MLEHGALLLMEPLEIDGLWDVALGVVYSLHGVIED